MFLRKLAMTARRSVTIPVAMSLFLRSVTEKSRTMFTTGMALLLDLLMRMVL